MNPPIFFTLLKHFAIFLPFVFFGKTGLCEPESIESKQPGTHTMKHEAKWLVQALEQAHFNKVPIDKLEPREFVFPVFWKGWINKNFILRKSR